MTSLETYCRKEFRIADIPLSGVSGVMGAVCWVLCAEVVWEMVGRSRVSCKVAVEPGGTRIVRATLVRSICLSLCPVEFSVGIVGLNCKVERRRNEIYFNQWRMHPQRHCMGLVARSSIV